MSVRFEVDTDDKDVVRATLSSALDGRALTDDEMSLALLAMRERSGPDDRFQLPPSVTGRKALGMRPAGGRYVINVPNAVLLSVAVTLDALWTRGVATALVAAAGKNPQVLSKLSESNGSLCHFITLEGQQNKAFPIGCDEIAEITSGQVCSQPGLSCSHRNDERCALTSEAVRANLDRLAASQTIYCDEDGKVTALA